jgi:hypothetical protein
VEVHPTGTSINLLNIGNGRSATIDELPADVRRKLPTITTTQN